MLTLWRHIARYRRAALVLVVNGQPIGEIVLLQAHGDGYGGARVQVGLNLPANIEIVRADAIQRPHGPTLEWLLRREEAFTAGAPERPPVRGLPYTAVGPYADATHTDDDTDPADCAADDDDGCDERYDERYGYTAAADELLAASSPSPRASGRHPIPPALAAPSSSSSSAAPLYAFRHQPLTSPTSNQTSDPTSNQRGTRR